MFPGVACRFWLFRGVWEKLWDSRSLCSQAIVDHRSAVAIGFKCLSTLEADGTIERSRHVACHGSTRP